MAGEICRTKSFEEVSVTKRGCGPSLIVREMKNRSLNKKVLDAIGRRLFKAEPVDSERIDRVISDPQLFTKVLERIAADLSDRKEPVAVASTSRHAVAGYIVAAISFFLIGSFAIMYNVKQPETAIKAPVQVVSSKVPDAAPEVVRPEVPPQPDTGKHSAGRTTKDTFRVERAILTRTEPANRPRRDAEPDTQFIPVSYTGDPEELSGGGQVIRVEMKRSSLFAIGIDVPLENDDTIVKADLLVGRDGVTRAIRMVD